MKGHRLMAPDFIYTLGEKFYIGNVDAVAERIIPNVEDPQYSRIILDLINVRICDSQGFRMLLNIHRKAAALGKELILYRPDRVLKETLDYMKLSHVFKISDTI